MTTTQNTSGKTKTILYWISTSLLVAGDAIRAVLPSFSAPNRPFRWLPEHLGYPVYALMSDSGYSGACSSAITLPLPGFRLFERMGFDAGFFFLMTGAVISHSRQRRWHQRHNSPDNSLWSESCFHGCSNACQPKTADVQI